MRFYLWLNKLYDLGIKTLDDIPKLDSRLSKLLTIALKLTTPSSTRELLTQILESLKTSVHADGGTLYLLDPTSQELVAEVVRNDTLGITNETESKDLKAKLKIPLYNGSEANERNLAASAVHRGRLINIHNRSNDDRFDFTGLDRFDQQNNYDTSSILTLPLIDQEQTILGVIQLINARDDAGIKRPFSDDDAKFALGIASLAAAALSNRYGADNLEQLFEYFAELIAELDDRVAGTNTSTGAQTAMLALALAKAMHQSELLDLADFKLRNASVRRLNIAAWLRAWAIRHSRINDIKTGKDETLIESLITQRFEILVRDLQIKLYSQRTSGESFDKHRLEHMSDLNRLKTCRKAVFELLQTNSFSSHKLEALTAEYQWTDMGGVSHKLVSEIELKQLVEAKSKRFKNHKLEQESARSIVDMLLALRLPTFLGSALNLANLSEIFTPADEMPPVSLSTENRLLYEAIRVSERAISTSFDNPSAGRAQIIIDSLRSDSQLNQNIVELFCDKQLFKSLL